MTQKEALKILKMGKNVFLTGPAGSGKTYLLNEYINFLNERGVNIAVTASTGIAATHIKGITIHSWSGLGIKENLTDYDLDFLEQKQYLWKRYEKTKVLIIDEISMLSANTLDSVDKIARMFKRSDSPFGGMQVIFCGDFFQLPPIIKNIRNNEGFIDYDEEPKTPFAFNSNSWRNSDLQICYLSEQFRQKDNDLLNILNSIRQNKIENNLKEILKNRILENEDEEITKLYTHNINVDDFNQKKLDSIDQPTKIYKMTSKGNKKLVETLKRGCLVPENLILKKDALVMFVKNNATAGYVNGTVGKIIDFEDGYPVVQTKDGEIFTALPQTWSIEEGQKVLAQIEQVPLKLAWAVTIHKSQGMTLNRAFIDLTKSFVEGQGYVALSRVKDLSGLYLKGFNQKSLEVHTDVLKIDKEFKDLSNENFENINKIKDKNFEKEHSDFLKKIDAKDYKISDNKGNKLSTFQITKSFIDEKRTIDEISSQRGLTKGTIIGHIDKLLETKSLKQKDILYLKPDTKEFAKMLNEIKEVLEELDDDKLTPIFKALNKKYTFEEIKFAKLFL